MSVIKKSLVRLSQSDLEKVFLQSSTYVNFKNPISILRNYPRFPIEI